MISCLAIYDDETFLTACHLKTFPFISITSPLILRRILDSTTGAELRECAIIPKSSINVGTVDTQFGHGVSNTNKRTNDVRPMWLQCEMPPNLGKVPNTRLTLTSESTDSMRNVVCDFSPYSHHLPLGHLSDLSHALCLFWSTEGTPICFKG